MIRWGGHYGWGQALEKGHESGVSFQLCISVCTLHWPHPVSRLAACAPCGSIACMLQVDGIPHGEWLAERKHTHPSHQHSSITRTGAETLSPSVFPISSGCPSIWLETGVEVKADKERKQFVCPCSFTSEKAMATHSSTLAWQIPWTGEPGGLQSVGSLESDTTERLHFHFSLSFIGEGNGNPLQCSCLENPRDGGAWWAAVYGVAQSWTRLKWLSSSSTYTYIHFCKDSFPI